ncbi:MAG: NAD-dependent epimerase/dehydratase family protein [Chloroflexi bacterium]|uniref:NAD-dependent epimerase/dehydratase family protein n=1 Tax=Candidatus Flexifilum breve TaxID=3140694 RepID=UPI003134FF78|nr:NAD-dependent epimerase/dehydratase family protein [Chloroflexota bacterium]
MNILVIGGTRNLGHLLVHQLIALGHRVSVFNRGLTRDELPDQVERLRGDRTKKHQLARALDGKSFDVVIDNALYKQEEAEEIAALLKGRVGHYLFLSSGQVYLVREGAARPFTEDQYEGRLMPAPKPNTYGYEEWLYGVDKRRVEDALHKAWETNKFPYTSLRLPMVNSERDHFNRLYNYVLRLNDGDPILAPSTPNFPLRHIYGGDVIRALLLLIETGKGKGQVYNISQDETLTLEEFLGIVGDLMGVQPQVVRLKRDLLEANGFLPDCSPFSERWMSELDNTRSKTELGMTYTPVREYLERILRYFEENPPPTPRSYLRRRSELLLLEHSKPMA